jgi:hypothetical protein
MIDKKRDSNIGKNKDENVHRFALRAIRGGLLEREREKEIHTIWSWKHQWTIQKGRVRT